LILIVFLSSIIHAQPQLAGPLSGTLGPGVYLVQANISVSDTDSLVILPGTTFQFMGAFKFDVYGKLRAEGALGDSIVFTRGGTAEYWSGVRLYNTNSDTFRFNYCVFEYSRALGPAVINSTAIRQEKYITSYSLGGDFFYKN